MKFISNIFQLSKCISRTSLVKPVSCSVKSRILSTSTNTLENFKISEIKNIERSFVHVTWNDGTSCDYPHIFLRDNCQCSKCFHPTSKQRSLDLVGNIDVDIKALSVAQSHQDDSVIVTWPDHHESIYDGDWLRARKFPETDDDVNSSTLYGIQQEPWTSKTMNEQLPFIHYDELMSSDKTLLRHLENIFIHGLSIIKNSPNESGILYKLANRVSHMYLKKTHYGEIFTVKNKASPNNLAYTADHLPLHVDLPFYSYQPEVQFLHCIEQSKGENSGTSLLSDGLRAAVHLQLSDPHAFDILTKIKYKFNDIGKDLFGEYNLEFERPIIGLDKFGNFESISYNNHVRSSFINAPSEVIKDCYKAYYSLTQSINSDVLYYKMCPGDIMCFNNKRVLHGRTSFDPTTTSRWLEGCYMDFDELSSIYRVVRKRTL